MILVRLTFILFFSLSIMKVFPQRSENQINKIFLEKEIIELKSYFQYRDSMDIKVSEVPIAWHLDHSLRTINEIYKALEASKPESFKRSFNFGRALVLITNKIPRGRAEAPEIVKPPEIISSDSLIFLMKEAENHLKAYEALPKDSFFNHPYLGDFRKKTAKRFLEIHTEHHLKIIRDILK